MKAPFQAPHVWPSPEYLLAAEQASEDLTLRECLQQSDCVLGILCDLTSKGVALLKEVLSGKEQFSGTLVVALGPAGPTRTRDMRDLLHLQDEFQGEHFKLQLRLLPLPSGVTREARYAVSPPSCLLLQNRTSGSNWLWIGSNGDLDQHRAYHNGSLNFLLQADSSLITKWVRRFDLMAAQSAPLKAESLEIPALVPAQGEIEAAQEWSDYCHSLYSTGDSEQTGKIEIDPKTGEIKATTIAGDPVEIASQFNKILKLPPELAEVLAYFQDGSLVSVDEASRIGPLTVPVKTYLFEQDSELRLGTVTRRQSFSLELLEKGVASEVERCRKINDTISLFSFSLGTGMHWIPKTAVPLLEAELNAMEKYVKELLGEVIGEGTENWVDTRWARYERDLKKMYLQIHPSGGDPPPEGMKRVRQEAIARLEKGIGRRLIPMVTYSRFFPEIREESEAVSGLSKVLSLLQSAAVTIRKPYADDFFQRNFTKRQTTLEQWKVAMNIFEDTAPQRLQKLNSSAVNEEIQEIKQTFDNLDLSEFDKLKRIWSIIRRSSTC